MINIRMQHQKAEARKLSPRIMVVGVGGAGGNAVNNMIAAGLEGVDFLVCNTDSQALENTRAAKKVQLGTQITGGLGAGAKPQVGQSAAEESLEEVMSHLEGANMTFITAGMGGGTGTGAAPVIARAARERGILTVGVVTKPFHFEGTLRMRMAEEGIAEMQNYVDTLIIIPNQNLFRVANEKTTFAEAFRMADSVLQSGVRGVTDLMVMPGLINLDFADVRSAMTEMGKAMMGTGEAMGDRRALEASESAINNPLLDDVSMKGARGVIINVTGGYDMTLFEVDEACNRIREEVDPNANIIFGSTFDESLEGIMRVTVLATGIDAQLEKKSKPVSVGGWTQTEQRARDATAMPAVPAIPVVPVAARAAQPKTYASLAQKVEQPAYASQARMAMPTGGEQIVQKPRAERFGDTFIPPQPVHAEQPDVSDAYGSASFAGQPVRPAASSAPQAPQIFTAAAQAQRPMPQAQQMYAPQDQQPQYAMPPAPQGMMPTASPRMVDSRRPARSPSLFERLSDTLGFSHREEDAPGYAQQQMAPSPPARPVQERLNIDEPARPAHAESELDIPAFLRRQAS